MDVEAEHSHIHHHKSGHRWVDLAIPIAALFVSFISIWIAWHHGHVMQDLVRQNERLVQANSLPFLQLSGSNVGEGGVRSVSFSVINEGIGPAEIRSVQILVDGRPVSNLGELLRACCAGQDFNGLATSTLSGRMIRPGASVAYINMPGGASETGQAVLDRVRQSERIVTQLCYCSVFDECWTISSADRERPRHVPQCEVPQPQYRT